MVVFTTFKNEELRASLFDAIWELWGPHIFQYRTEGFNINMKSQRSLEPFYKVMKGMMHIFTTHPLPIDQVLLKGLKDDKIRFSGKVYEQNGKKWHHRPDFKTRAGAEALRRLGLTQYVVPTIDGYPDYSEIGWIFNRLHKFRDFHETWMDIFYRRIEEYKEKNQRNEDLEGAYEVLEKLSMKRGFPKKYYPTREIPWHAKN